MSDSVTHNAIIVRHRLHKNSIKESRLRK